MDLNEIAIYIQVVQSGSFSQAAKKMGIPNSTVSNKISTLEARLGVTLIKRTTRKLNVTPEGEAFFKKCLAALEEIREAESEIISSQGEPQGHLRITAPVELGNSILPTLISKYIEKYPKVSVEILLVDRNVDLLGENIDLAIRAGELKDSSLKAKRIGSTYFVPVASPKYLKNKGTPSHPQELINHSCLQFTAFGIDSWKMAGPRGIINVPVPGKLIVNHLVMLKMMALRGDGIAYLPTFFVYPEVAAGKLVRILPEWRSQTSPVHFLYPGQKFTTPKLSSFIEFASEDLKKNFAVFEI